MTNSPILTTFAALFLLVSAIAPTRAQIPGPDSENVEIGTAFAVASDGTFLTTAHELDGCRSVKLLVRNMVPVEAKTVAYDMRPDLALIHATLSRPLPALALRSASDPEVGESVFLLGYPLQQPLHLLHSSFFMTLVSGIDGIGGDPDVFRLPIVVLPGMSGSAVLDAGGLVTGMVRTHLVQSAPNNGPTFGGESFVTSSRAIAGFLRANNVRVEASDHDGAGLPPTEVAAKASASSAAIICRK
jgi:serine protease Do